MRRSATARGVRLELRPQPAVAAELDALVAAERECCPFLTMRVQRAGRRLILGVEAPPDAQAIVAAMFDAGGRERGQRAPPRFRRGGVAPSIRGPRPAETAMTYVIAEPCIGTKDNSCVEVCPVDCIHPTPDEPDYENVDMLYIDPVECIDCDACVETCPVDAIFAEDQLPEEWQRFTQINADYFSSEK
jgi:ferredoxin